MSRISGVESSPLAAHAEAMFSEYDRTFSGLPELHKEIINALCECAWNLDKGDRWTFTSTEPADKLWFAINSGEFRLAFKKDEIVQFFVKNNIPMYPDWEARLRVISEIIPTSSGAGRPIAFSDTRMLVKILKDKGYGHRRILAILNKFVKQQKDRNNFNAVDVPQLCTKGKRLNEDMIKSHIRGLQSMSQDWCHNGVFIEKFQDWVEENNL